MVARYSLVGLGSNAGGGMISRTYPYRCGAPTASCTMGTGSLSLRVKRPGCGVERPTLSSAEVKVRVDI